MQTLPYRLAESQGIGRCRARKPSSITIAPQLDFAVDPQEKPDWLGATPMRSLRSVCHSAPLLLKQSTRLSFAFLCVSRETIEKNGR
jgi:hypothetical protein